MKYEAPELNKLTSAISAVKSCTIEINKSNIHLCDSQDKEGHVGYADWED